MIASCSFLPLDVRGTRCIDGLVTNFFAPLPAAQGGAESSSYDTVLRMCSVPQILRPYNFEKADISPDGRRGSDRFRPLQPLSIAFQQSTVEELKRLASHGMCRIMIWYTTQRCSCFLHIY